MSEDVTAYYRRRETSARKLAEAAEQPGIRRIHLYMADHYAAEVAAEETGTTMIAERQRFILPVR